MHSANSLRKHLPVAGTTGFTWLGLAEPWKRIDSATTDYAAHESDCVTGSPETLTIFDRGRNAIS